MLQHKFVPAFVDKWPRNIKRIRVQQDNAPAHASPGVLWTGHGLSVELVCEPPQSPDLNVLELGYFAAIQSLQQQKRATVLVSKI